jgi:pimeloyl-ACP methyl ester carboxylesterase
MSDAPLYILYAQHGWADTHREIQQMARSIADPQAMVIAPDLGYLRTWWRIQPLIEQVDQIASNLHQRYPTLPKRIIGHSMGGLIWLEVLNRHPDWWPQIEFLSLIASPIGGADWGRIIDPMRLGVGIARDLGTNRRTLAQNIAQHIPTQIIAGNSDGGSDGTVPLQCTQFTGARYVELNGIKHEKLKNHPAVAQAIQQFWANPSLISASEAQLVPPSGPIYDIIQQLRAIRGMTDAHYRDFPKAKGWADLTDRLNLRTWKNPAGVHHVFLADRDNRCWFAGYVGWLDTDELYRALKTIKATYQP